jgi:hypothetical protein
MCGSIASLPLVDDGQVELVEPFGVDTDVDGEDLAALIAKAARTVASRVDRRPAAPSTRD